MSCLMVTQASRWETKTAPIGALSYLCQTYERRELVIVTADPCKRMLDFAAMVERCTVVQLDAGAKMGALRNAAVGMAAGDFVATWDDDDWSGAFRLEEQVDCVRLNPVVDACCLNRVVVHDEVHARKFVSPRHCWDPTMVARRESMPDYDPEKHMGEDGELIAKFARMALLDKPELYTYRIHAGSLSGQVMAEEWWTWAQANGAVIS